MELFNEIFPLLNVLFESDRLPWHRHSRASSRTEWLAPIDIVLISSTWTRWLQVSLKLNTIEKLLVILDGEDQLYFFELTKKVAQQFCSTKANHIWLHSGSSDPTRASTTSNEPVPQLNKTFEAS